MPPYSTQERATQRWDSGVGVARDAGEQAAARIRRHKENRALIEEQEIADRYGRAAGSRRVAWRSLEPRRTKEREKSLVLIAEERWTGPGTPRFSSSGSLLNRRSPPPSTHVVDERLIVAGEFEAAGLGCRRRVRGRTPGTGPVTGSIRSASTRPVAAEPSPIRAELDRVGASFRKARRSRLHHRHRRHGRGEAGRAAPRTSPSVLDMAGVAAGRAARGVAGRCWYAGGVAGAE